MSLELLCEKLLTMCDAQQSRIAINTSRIWEELEIVFAQQIAICII